MKYNNAEDNSENNDLASCQNYGYSGSNSEYNETIEGLIKSKGEQCEVLSKLHLMAHKKYKRSELFFNIPIITITALVGFVSALDVKFEHINIIIGVFSLFVSLLKSYLSFLKISQKNENHRVAYLQYYQISNEIRIELSLARNIRQPANYLLNLIKIKMKNLNEVSELIDNEVIETYTKRNQYNILYHQIGHPDILDDIRPIEICKWENDVEKTEKNKENTDEKKEIEEVKENTDENV